MGATVSVQFGDDLAFRLAREGNALVPSLPVEREAVRAALRGALDCLADSSTEFLPAAKEYEIEERGT